MKVPSGPAITVRMDELNMSLTVFHTGSSFASARSPTSSWDAAAFIVSPKLDAKNHAVEAREPDEEFAPPPCASASSVLSASPPYSLAVIPSLL